MVYYRSQNYGKLSLSDYPANIPLLPFFTPSHFLEQNILDSHLSYLPCPAKIGIVPGITDHIHFLCLILGINKISL